MNRRIVLGVDEAGYGPNLGPLIVAVSSWEIPAAMSEDGLIGSLADDFQPKRIRAGTTHIPLGDSKQLYSPSGGLDSLEAGALGMLRAAGQTPKQQIDFNTFLASIAILPPPTAGEDPQPPWYDRQQDGLHPGVPADSEQLSAIEEVGQRAQSALDRQGIRFLGAKLRMVTEPQFNHQLSTLGSKGLLLSRETLGLVSEEVKLHARRPIEVFCDRQGGRKNYLPVLQDTWADSWFQPLAQASQRSSYFDENLNLKVHFTVKGDRFPATALASMVAKYTRERCMQSFNAFWANQLPGIKPTAGYPVDAQRFRDAIERKTEELDLPLDMWWRQK